MEPILNRIRKSQEKFESICRERENLYEEAKRLGVQWQEVAFIDKFLAIKLYREQEKCDLHFAKSAVENWLTQRKPELFE
jgi:hypothetical protein